ncbi:hypothetical protein CDL12_06001 [Handroanthus impetiginosus]|uniref:Uncharacterized protein n=1 Tax=Handroanthus impetiginosus TaxID=429701 RepID=A0A2G9HUW3_9LAMI|nr:hypothetical protein CDL12_06001 [Handroanthus impetiginosus]
MKTKREESKDGVDNGASAKRLKLTEESPSQLAFENPLLPLASYDDDDDDKDDDRRGGNGGKLGNNGRKTEQNGHNYYEQDDDE